MAIDNKFKRCEPDDPKRCQASVKTGQCPYLSKVGNTFCPMHTGMQTRAIEKKNIRLYNLHKWQARVNEFSEHEKVKTLREEIGILRLLLENILMRCTDQSDLLLHSPKISELVLKIEKLVVSCHRMEEATGSLVDKSSIINVSINIVDIISNFIEDERLIDSISEKIKESIENNTLIKPLQVR